MASSRKVGTNEEVATYGTGKTYTSLATWEADTDIDLVTATKSCVLEIYGNSYNDGNCTLAEATTNASYFRIIRPVSGNKLTSGAISTKHFVYTADSTAKIITIQEPYTECQDIVASRTLNYNNSSVYAFRSVSSSTDANAFVGCVAIDCSNSYAGKNCAGFNAFSMHGGDVYFKNCLAHNCDGSGFVVSSMNASSRCVCYNCSSIGNALYGFTGLNVDLAYGCGADGNSSGDFNTLTQVNCSADTPTFAAGTDNFHLADNDTVWKDADTNTGSWHSSCGYDDDVDGDTRTGSWDIGWDEVTGGGASIIPHILTRKPFRHMLIR